MGSQLGTLEPLRLSTPTTTRRPSAFLPVPISRVTLPSHRPVPTQSSRRPTQLHSVPLIFAADLFKEPASSSCSGSRVRPVQSWKFASDPADQARRAWCHRGKGSSAYSALGPLKSETGVRFAVGAPIEFAHSQSINFAHPPPCARVGGVRGAGNGQRSRHHGQRGSGGQAASPFDQHTAHSSIAGGGLNNPPSSPWV